MLIFGGNGFIGSEVTKLLLADCGSGNDKLDITVVNRGKSWDWDTNKSIKPFVKQIQHDRDTDIFCCADLVKLSRTEKLDVIVDFSGYDSHAVKDAVKLFRNKVGLYIYISSDSVYEVCNKNLDTFSVETDAVRPASCHQRKLYKEQDSYGHDKLKCEEVLQSQSQDHGIPFLVLRLADVIGAYDSTERWWQYQLWASIAVNENVPVYVPQDLKHKQISLVYVKDVALIIKNIVCMDSYVSIQNQAYNLAFNETCTVKELLENIALNACDQNVQVEFSSGYSIPHIYPSVDKGPINCSKAKDMLMFHPTSLQVAISQIVLVYKSIEKSEMYNTEKQDIYSSLKKDLKNVYEKETYLKLMTSIKHCLGLKVDNKLS